MNVLLIDQEGYGLDFALRCIESGHAVRWWRYDAAKHREGEGFVGLDMVPDWKSSMAWARDGLILCTGNWKFMGDLDRYRDLGFKIFGPTAKSAALEIKREVGMEAMKAAGIDVPPYKTFDSLEAAEKFARKGDKIWVFKTMGDEDDKAMSYVPSDPADLVGWIGHQIERGMKLKGPCMLQEKIDMCCEVGVSGWFGPDGFLPGKWQMCFEFKKLMVGDNGPNTGEQGTVCQYSETDKLADEMLTPMAATLQKLGHRGDFAIGAGIDKKGKAWPFEFTARLGWPAFFIQVASHKGDPARWMRDLLDGKDSLRVSSDVAIGVVCAQPRYPYDDSKPEQVEGNPISGIDDAIDDVHMVSVMIGRGPKMIGEAIVDGPTYQTTGEYVLVATGLGPSVEKARAKVYGSIDKIKFPNMMFRNDIGLKLENSLPELQKFGYARSMVFA